MLFKDGQLREKYRSLSPNSLRILAWQEDQYERPLRIARHDEKKAGEEEDGGPGQETIAAAAALKNDGRDRRENAQNHRMKIQMKTQSQIKKLQKRWIPL